MMDYENNSYEQEEPIQNNAEPEFKPEPVPRPMQVVEPVKSKKKGIGFFGFIFRLFFAFSIIGNFLLLLVVIALASMFSMSSNSYFEKSMLFDGGGEDKITVINLKGAIDGDTSESVRRQFAAATQDEAVKGVILRIDSPGGTVGASDQIHHEISKYRQVTGKPVVAFMQNVAASGGYYSAVACNEIIAEPTVITGSIGVIMHNFVLKDLLEEKLGITPVTIKSGLKKDWPSNFDVNTPEQIEYIQEKLIGPAYSRFVDLVAAGREDKLTKEKAIEIADGSIFSAPEALEKKLIDNVGYIEQAVFAVERLAGIVDSQVFEYKNPFSFASMLSAHSEAGISIDKGLVSKFTTPQLMYIWDASGY
jgi:protease IV